MKKCLALLLAVTLFALCGCGSAFEKEYEAVSLRRTPPILTDSAMWSGRKNTFPNTRYSM